MQFPLKMLTQCFPFYCSIKSELSNRPIIGRLIAFRKGEWVYKEGTKLYQINSQISSLKLIEMLIDNLKFNYFHKTLLVYRKSSTNHCAKGSFTPITNALNLSIILDWKNNLKFFTSSSWRNKFHKIRIF